MKVYNAYDILSQFYDEFIEKNCSQLHDKYLNLIKDILNKNKIKPNSILDCTCGTGILMKKLQDEGYHIEGLDLNENMLSKARDKGLKVFQEDIRNFKLKEKYDLIFSFDSFGHLTTNKELISALINISNHLNDDGLLIFDGGTKAKALNMVNKKYTFDSDKYSFVWKNYIQDDKVKVEICIDIKSKDQKSNSLVEKFELCGHDVDEIKAALSKTDLSIDFITTEPLVKIGSFVCCCRKKM